MLDFKKLLVKMLHVDFRYPVGSYYATSNANFDPNTSWGGTWEPLPEGYVLLSGSDSGSYIVGDDTSTASGYKEYGENTHTLIADELPSHTHGNKSLTGYFTMRRGGTNNTQNIWAGGIASVQTNSEGASYNLNYASSTNNADRININASHEHTSVGLNKAHNIMQKSIAVYWWIRTA